ncbi:uncharacterized protein LOC119732818 [Patiria miniata]|uniref:Reverse transcriptase domain-containing protein n=1 Tax=Patiria miniata TaxID=46514 RepID=A0A914AG47_PATMI|nr:uncharacterized protein LOC119732818 [Patiria miniata]
MRTGLSDSLDHIDDSRKTAIIDHELDRLNSAEETREHGDGFAVKNTLIATTVPPTGGSERILAIRISTSSGPANLLSVYAPTLCSPPESKDKFYEELDTAISTIPKNEHLFLLGDFNARVGADHESWPDCLGHFGVGSMNENGQRLLELCCYHQLCITNTFFQTKPLHRVSWRHPRSKRWHQLDLIITRRETLNFVHFTRTFHSADCDTDHSLVLSKVKLQPRQIHHAKQKARPRINASRSINPTVTQLFLTSLDQALSSSNQQSAVDKWNCLRDTIYDQALAAYDKKVRKNADWFEANGAEMEPVIEVKRTAFLKYKDNPSTRNLEALRKARGKAQQTARRCANNYWLKLSSRIQAASDAGDIRGMYEGIKQATGPSIKKTAPLKSKSGEVITDSSKQMERWAEHYMELYATENTVSEEALNGIANMPVMEELDTDPTQEELSKAIDSLACGKAPGADGITPDIIQLGKPTLLPHLHDFLCLCWNEGAVPQDMRDAKIVTLYKNKGDRSDCNNYRGISLLSTVGKVFARVALIRLQLLAERVYPETQCGFRAARSTVDMIFTLRQLQEKCREQRRPLYLAFVDLTKAFDLVSRDGLFKLLAKIGCPPKLLSIVTSFYNNMQGSVCCDGETSEAFPIRSGVKQGCVLAPTLFGIFFSLLLSFAFGSSPEGVYLPSRADGKLFNLARLRSKTKVTSVLLREMLFADDASLASHTETGLQQLVDRLSYACKEFALTISIKKTHVMGQEVETPPSISIDNKTLDCVGTFTYLGSTVASNLSLDAELSTRLARAATVMARLAKRVWSNKNLTVRTKLQVYQACVISTLLYSSEAWTTYTRQEKRLNSFHLRCLRRILGIKWQDKVPNTEVLERAHSTSMFAMLSQRRLRWLGHVHRMDSGRLPRAILYGELSSGSRPIGRPNLRFKDVCKRDMRQAGIDPNSWEEAAQDRSAWRQTVAAGIHRAEERRTSLLQEKRQRRKLRVAAPSPESVPSPFVCANCGRDCHARIGLLSHSRRCNKDDNPPGAVHRQY